MTTFCFTIQRKRHQHIVVYVYRNDIENTMPICSMYLWCYVLEEKSMCCKPENDRDNGLGLVGKVPGIKTTGLLLDNLKKRREKTFNSENVTDKCLLNHFLHRTPNDVLY